MVGAGDAGERELELAFAVGRALARAGAIVVCGGLGGVMRAASAGAREAGGLSVGLLPGADRREGNEHLSIAIATGIGELRNGLIVRSADAVIAIGGEWGTLSEIALALKLGRPVIGLDTWDLGARAAGAIERAPDAAAAVTRALELAGAGRAR